MSNTVFFALWNVNSLFAFDNGKEEVRHIVSDQINFGEKKILKFEDSVLAFNSDSLTPVTVVQLIGLKESAKI